MDETYIFQSIEIAHTVKQAKLVKNTEHSEMR